MRLSHGNNFSTAVVDLGTTMLDSTEKITVGATKEVMYDDLARIASDDNKLVGKYGGCIWSLNILPGLCSNTFPVYIEKWSVKPSNEIDANGMPSYCDFDIICVMDQIKPGFWWQAMLMSDDYEAYKQLQKAYNNKVSSTV